MVRGVPRVGFDQTALGIQDREFHVSGILETSKYLPITAAAKESSNLVVTAEKRNEKLGASVLKNKSQIPVATAFEELASEFADTKAAVDMGLTKTIN
jgi:hypothetical protein